MNLADAIAHDEAKLTGPRCKVGRIRDAMDNTTRELLDNLLASRRSHSRIERILKNADIDVSDHSIRVHRTGQCMCR